MAPAYAFEERIPVVHPDAFLHPDSVLIGDVRVGAGCYIGPCASLRGDFGRVIVLEGANIQDSCVLHCFPDSETVVGPGGHIGHGAVLHGCRIEEDALIGMNAVIMDGAVIGAQCFVGANSFVKSGQNVPERHLAAGSPARVLRELTADEIAWKQQGTRTYQELARRCLRDLRPVTPLSTIRAAEARRTDTGPRHVTLHEHRARLAGDPADKNARDPDHDP